jgi:hypothetical protein
MSTTAKVAIAGGSYFERHRVRLGYGERGERGSSDARLRRRETPLTDL